MSERVILVADNSPSLMEAVVPYVADWGFRIVFVTEHSHLMHCTQREQPELLFLNLRFGNDEGIQLLAKLRGLQLPPDIVAFEEVTNVPRLIQAIKLGAVDFLTIPFDLGRLEKIICSNRHACHNDLHDDVVFHDHASPGCSETTPTAKLVAPERKKEMGQRTANSLPAVLAPCPRMIGNSEALRRITEFVSEAAPTDANVLIDGETGTGKELVAMSLHEASDRRHARFCAVNVASLPDSLAESMLFGHERGAFTGADRTQIGWFEMADGGTLFLDEIGEMNLLMQAKLLRFLQDRTFMRIGSCKLSHANVRVIAATNRDLPALIVEGQFREDLYYRLNVLGITVPPLRKRSVDIPPLVEHILKQAIETHRLTARSFDGPAMQLLLQYEWPGNIRQLENVVVRAAIMTRSNVIGVDALPVELFPLPKYSAEHRDDARPIEGLREIDQFERSAILMALVKTKGNAVAAAAMLGLGQATMYRKIKRYGIDLRRQRDNAPSQSIVPSV